jgi:hypothetical protein
MPSNDGRLVYTDKPTLSLSKSKAIFEKIKYSQAQMIKEQIDFKEMSVNMLLLISVYLAIDASLGSALGTSTSFILLKTLVGFALIFLVAT